MQQLTYHGGSVMRTNTAYAIYWIPAGYTVSANYASLINGFFQNVAADSGAVTNVYSSDVQYTDSTGPIAYTSAFGGSVTDTSAFPASGCTDVVVATTVCLTDSQLQSEIDSVITAQGWPRGSHTAFFLFTPRNVGSCVDADGTQCAFVQYCAYHSDFGSGASRTIYANMPYAATDPAGCGTPSSPNNDDADSTINVTSHEHNEAITDPFGTGWYDESNEENGDKCAWSFGSPLGSTGSGLYNQAIGSGHYYLQQEWSNADSGCVLNMAPPVNTAVPVITGTAQSAQTLTASTGSWTSTSTPTYAYQWRRCNSSGGSCTDIGGATASSYTAGPADVGGTLLVGVIATATAHGSSAPAYSAATGVVAQISPPMNTGRPTISGTAQAGLTLTASQGMWTSAGSLSFAYQWQRCDSSGGSCASIAAATSSAYGVVTADVGSTLQVAVSATNLGGTTGPSVSIQTGVVIAGVPPANTVLPQITGTAQSGSTLSVSTGTWAGTGTISYAFQWQRCNAAGSPCVPIGGASSATYPVEPADVGSTLNAVVTATDAGGSLAATAAPTELVSAAPSGGGGGGGGGLVNLHVTVGASPTPHNAGDAFAYLVTIVNNGSLGTDSTTLTVNLPAGAAFVSAKADRGPGCNAAGTTVTCFLDFFPPELSTTVIVNLQAGPVGTLTCTASVVSSPGDSDPSDDSATLSLQLGATGQPAGVAPSSTGSRAIAPAIATLASKQATLALSPLKTIHLDVPAPRLTVAAKLSKAARLGLTLVDAHGRTVARWTRKVKAGDVRLALTLPPAARHRGRDTLRIAIGTGKAISRRVVLTG